MTTGIKTVVIEHQEGSMNKSHMSTNYLLLAVATKNMVITKYYQFHNSKCCQRESQHIPRKKMFIYGIGDNKDVIRRLWLIF